MIQRLLIHIQLLDLAPKWPNMGATRSTDIQYWAHWLLIGLLVRSLLSRLLRSRMFQRKTKTHVFTRNLLRVSSEICFFVGPLTACMFISSGFSSQQYTGSSILFGTFYVFMAFYQMSRLWCCFINDQVRDLRGYAPWILLVMIIVGSCLLISWTMLYLLVNTVSTVLAIFGYKSGGVSFWKGRYRSMLFDAHKFIFSEWSSKWRDQITLEWSSVPLYRLYLGRTLYLNDALCCWFEVRILCVCVLRVSLMLGLCLWCVESQSDCLWYVESQYVIVWSLCALCYTLM